MIIISNDSDRGCKNEKKQYIVLKIVILKEKSYFIFEECVGIRNILFSVIHWSAKRVGSIIP
jgi:hypothetical protein